MPLAWAFVMRAGDGNRTRTTSLGIVRFSETMGADLRPAVLASDPC
jgi:hypothetical protein